VPQPNLPDLLDNPDISLIGSFKYDQQYGRGQSRIAVCSDANLVGVGGRAC